MVFNNNEKQAENITIHGALYRYRIAAAGSNVYVSWWERNQTSNEPVLRISNDNGKTFGDKIMLSEK